MKVNSSHLRTRKGKGFTLVELLVVVTVIAILAAILLPSLKGARDKAKQVKCISNVKQLLVASLMYVQDWRFKPYPQENSTMILWYATNTPANYFGPANLGLLYYNGYIENPLIFKCPSTTYWHPLSSGAYNPSYTDDRMWKSGEFWGNTTSLTSGFGGAYALRYADPIDGIFDPTSVGNTTKALIGDMYGYFHGILEGVGIYNVGYCDGSVRAFVDNAQKLTPFGLQSATNDWAVVDANYGR